VGTVLVPENDKMVEVTYEPAEDEIPWYSYRWVDCRDDVRVSDLPVLTTDCLLGPGVPAPNGCVNRWDYDDDGDVDMADIAHFQIHAEDWDD